MQTLTEEINYPNIEKDYSLPVFAKDSGTSKYVDKKAMDLIMTMIDLHYLDHNLNFTNAGIEYMMRCHKEFLQNLEKNRYAPEEVITDEKILERLRDKFSNKEEMAKKFINKAYGLIEN